MEEKNQVQDWNPEQGHEGGEESTLETEVKPGKSCRRPCEARFSRKRERLTISNGAERSNRCVLRTDHCVNEKCCLPYR